MLESSMLTNLSSGEASASSRPKSPMLFDSVPPLVENDSGASPALKQMSDLLPRHLQRAASGLSRPMDGRGIAALLADQTSDRGSRFRAKR